MGNTPNREKRLEFSWGLTAGKGSEAAQHSLMAFSPGVHRFLRLLIIEADRLAPETGDQTPGSE